MSFMRQASVSAAVIAAALFSAPAGAQWAVFDGASLTQALKQVQAWQQQYAQMQSQIASMTGNRGMSTLLPTIVPALPSNWNGAMTTLSPAAQQIKSAQTVLTPQQTASLTPQLQNYLGQIQTLSAATQAMGQAAFNDAAARQSRLQTLTNTLATTSDPKAAYDLSNAIGIEHAGLLKDQNQLIAAANSAAAQSQAQQQMENQMRATSAGSGNFPKIDTSLPY